MITPGADAVQQDEGAARRFLARHYWVMASAENVGDWHAYIRTCARAQEDGSAWLDSAALDELRAALATRPSADAETLRRVAVELARQDGKRWSDLIPWWHEHYTNQAFAVLRAVLDAR